jgi:deoxyribonucleoside regulator
VTSREERGLLLRAARLYYEANQTQKEIAEHLQVSRSTVSRLLRRAREQGIVRISIQDSLAATAQLAQALMDRFELRDVVVAAQTWGLPDSLGRKRIGQAAARYLCQILGDGALVGIGWGRTLYEMVEALEECEAEARIDVIPLLGGLAQVAPSFQVNELARRLGDFFGGSWRPCFIPAILPDKATHESLKRMKDIRQMMELWKALDVAVVGIGNNAYDSEFEVLFARYLEPEMKDRLRDHNVAGDLCMRFFTREGIPQGGWTREIMGIELEELQRIPCVIGLAGGSSKTEALLGAISGGYINTLVTDEPAAEGLLKAVGD